MMEEKTTKTSRYNIHTTVPDILSWTTSLERKTAIKDQIDTDHIWRKKNIVM